MSNDAGPYPSVPVPALSYVSQPQVGRPGIITAIGVMSIVVAVLSLFANLIMGLWALAFYAMLSAAPMAAAAAAAGPGAGGGTVAIATADVEESGTDVEVEDASAALRLTPQQRSALVGSLNSVRPLSDAQKQQLDVLLTECGRDMFPAASQSTPPTTQAVVGQISDSGRTEAVEGQAPTHYFILGTGRLEVGDKTASFRPSGGGSAIYVRDGRVIEGIGGRRSLTPQQVQAIVRHVREMAGKELTDARADALASALEDHWQPIVNATESTDDELLSQILWANVQPDGSIMIHSQTGAWIVPLSGKARNAWVMPTTPAGGGAGAGGAALTPMMPTVSPSALLMATLDVLLGGALGIYLLVCGIQVLRQSLNGARLHWIYAVAKLPVTLIGWAAWVWLWTSLTTSLMRTAGPGAPAAQIGTVWLTVGVVMAVIGCLYPVALMITLSTRTVREYYSGVVMPAAQGGVG